MPAERAGLFVFFGLIASGKSTLAEAFAEAKGLAAFNSDRVRKELAGVPATSRERTGCDQGIYTPAFSRRTYDELLARAGRELAAGRSAVLDASYQSRAERRQVLEFAVGTGASVVFILCQCSEAETRRRLERRSRDRDAVSDGRWEIFVVQRQRFEPPDELPAGTLLTVDTEQEAGALLKELEERLARTGSATGDGTGAGRKVPGSSKIHAASNP